MGLSLLIALSFFGLGPPNAIPAFTDRLGLELEGLGDGGRSKPFVDLARTLRPWTQIGNDARAPVDAMGWPTSDAQTVLFDIRPVAAWAPPTDDPDAFMPDWSGTYLGSFEGQARVTDPQGRPADAEHVYDAKTNRTTFKLNVSKGTGLLVLQFRETRRKPGDPPGTGLTNLRILRPGYAADTARVFTLEFLAALKPFRVLRYMDWLDTNHNPGYYGDTGHHALEWKDRRPRDYATQVNDGRFYGIAWELIVELANATKTDAWINIPVAATDGYIRECAKFLKSRLRPECVLYIEHSNEVWNFGFPQYIYNKLAAADEVKQGGSPLNNDGSTDEERWTHRRHAKRLRDIAMIFADVFGKSELGKRLRPVYASWVISPGPHYRDVLAWCEKTYGPPKNYFYSLAVASYYSAHDAAKDATPDQVLDTMFASSRNSVRMLEPIKKLADDYGLKFMQYEIGPDNGGGSTVNVANRIRANRLPRVKDLILENARQWFRMGGDLYMYFAAPSAYSRYGCWGLSEDIADLDTPKWQAIYELAGMKR